MSDQPTPDSDAVPPPPAKVDGEPGGRPPLAKKGAPARPHDTLPRSDLNRVEDFELHAAGEPPWGGLPPEGDRVLAGYRLIRLIGRGGMGVVYEAADTHLDRHVAMKILSPALAADPGANERFRIEARAAAAVDHENIIPVYHVGEERGVLFLTMPLLRGEPLDHRLEVGPELGVAEAVAVARQVALGLAAAHEAGLVHRDVKPSNVWLEEDSGGDFRRVRLLDFGLARLARPDVPMTPAGSIMGTPEYMAPEQALGHPADSRSDLFSLGVILYQMLTHHRPFLGSDPRTVLSAVVADFPIPVGVLNPAVPDALTALVERLMHKDPPRRPATAGEVVRELTAIAEAQNATGPHPATEAAHPRQAGWRWQLRPFNPEEGADQGAAHGRDTVVRARLRGGELIVLLRDPSIRVAVQVNRIEVVDTLKGSTYTLTPCGTRVEVADAGTGLMTLSTHFRLQRDGKDLLIATALPGV